MKDLTLIPGSDDHNGSNVYKSATRKSKAHEYKMAAPTEVAVKTPSSPSPKFIAMHAPNNAVAPSYKTRKRALKNPKLHHSKNVPAPAASKRDSKPHDKPTTGRCNNRYSPPPREHVEPVTVENVSPIDPHDIGNTPALTSSSPSNEFATNQVAVQTFSNGPEQPRPLLGFDKDSSTTANTTTTTTTTNTPDNTCKRLNKVKLILPSPTMSFRAQPRTYPPVVTYPTTAQTSIKTEVMPLTYDKPTDDLHLSGDDGSLATGGIDYYFPDQDTSLADLDEVDDYHDRCDEPYNNGSHLVGFTKSYYRRTLPNVPSQKARDLNPFRTNRSTLRPTLLDPGHFSNHTTMLGEAETITPITPGQGSSPTTTHSPNGIYDNCTKELPVDDIVINTLSMTLTTPESPLTSPTCKGSPHHHDDGDVGCEDNFNDLWVMRDNLLKVQKERKELDIIRYDIEQQRLAEKLFPKYKPAATAPLNLYKTQQPSAVPSSPPLTGQKLRENSRNNEEDELGSIETCRLLNASPPLLQHTSSDGKQPFMEETSPPPPRNKNGAGGRRKSLNNLFSPLSDCSNEDWATSSVSDHPHNQPLPRDDLFAEAAVDKVESDKSLTPSPSKHAETKPKVKEGQPPSYDEYESTSSDDDAPDIYKPNSAPYNNRIFGSTMPCTSPLYCKIGTQQTPASLPAPPSYYLKQKMGAHKTSNILNPSVLIEGVLFRASYLGSTHIYLSQWSNKRHSRTLQAKEAVTQVKAGEGENQPRTDVDLFISTEKIMVLNTNLQSEQVQVIKYEEIMMDHSLKTISYIADIGDIVVVMARRNLKNLPLPTNKTSIDQAINNEESFRETYPPDPDACKINSNSSLEDKMICHVFESEEAHLIAQSIGQAFQIAYMDFLKANGIEDTSLFQDMDYQDVLNAQEIFGEELALFAKKETQREVVVPKSKGEILGLVIVESGWGSMIPTVVVANLLPGGPASRGRLLNIGDQIISVNGISLVGLPLINCQNYIKATQRQTVVKLTIVRCSPVVEVKIKRPDSKFQLGFSVQNGTICSLLRGGIAERGGVRVGHRIIEINGESVVAVPHEKIVKILSTTIGEIHMKTMPTSIFRLLTGQENPTFI